VPEAGEISISRPMVRSETGDVPRQRRDPKKPIDIVYTMKTAGQDDQSVSHQKTSESGDRLMDASEESVR
jgi:hypothetical protein